MKKGLKIGLLGIAALLGIGCSALPGQNPLDISRPAKGSLRVLLVGALPARSTQATLDNVTSVQFTLQYSNGDSIQNDADLSYTHDSASYTFRDLFPGAATLSAAVYGDDSIHTQANHIQSVPHVLIGTASVAVNIQSGENHVSLSSKLIDTRVYAGGLDIGLSVLNGNETFNLMPEQEVSTFAGNGKIGSVDAARADASFYFPSGVAVDASGNFYVADTYSNQIRKITSAGAVTRFAGSAAREAGCDNGDATTAAKFNHPTGVAVDASGNVYVADIYSNQIRKITSAGAVTLFAGSADGTWGNADGDATTAAKFNNPSGVAVDSEGKVYVADTYNNRVCMIQGGLVSTLATGAAGSFCYPMGVAVDTEGYVYVADSGNNRVCMIKGGVVSIIDTGAVGSFSPKGVAVDASGSVYVADTYNNRICKFSPDPGESRVVGTGNPGSHDGPYLEASFYCPAGVAVDASGNVYVADTENSRIRKIRRINHCE